MNEIKQTDLKYWVEARTSVRDRDIVIGYSVHYRTDTGHPERIKLFVVRHGNYNIPLNKANSLRDKLNSEQIKL